MSWNLDITGLRAQVKAAILAPTRQNDCIPMGIRKTIADICDDAKPHPQSNGVRVVGYGHQGGGFGSVGKLEVIPIEILLPPVDASESAAVAGK